jgi:CDP-2,3-bis-(O-geranylgeranyl)-sn-glycerol synthase
MHHRTVLRVLLLVVIANGSPIIAKRALGPRARPIDSNRRFVDGRPLLGRSKTLRGLASSMLLTSAAAPLLSLDVMTGFLVALSAMSGDLLSSFIKRRMGSPPSSRASGIDQLPEALFPLLACRKALSLDNADIALGTALFFVGEVLISRLLFKLHVRDRPY